MWKGSLTMPRGRPRKLPPSMPPRSLSGTRHRKLLALAYRLQTRALRLIAVPRRPQREPASEFDQRLTYSETVTTILLTVLSGGVTMMTYLGVTASMTEGGAGPLQRGEALVFSLGLGVLSFLGWFWVFGIVQHLRGSRLLLGGGAAAIYLAVFAAIDAPFIMRGLGGDAAARISLMAVADNYQERIAAVAAAASKGGQLAPAIRAQEARFKADKETEIKSGSGTGKPGPGRVSGAFGSIETLMHDLGNSLERNTAKASAVHQDAVALFGRLKAEADRYGPLRERSTRVSALADEIDRLLGDLANLDVAPALRSTLASLENLAPAPAAPRNSFEAVQAREVERINAAAKPVAQSLRAALDDLTASKPAMAHALRPLRAEEAIYAYWTQLISNWSAAIAVDLCPGLILLIVIAGRRESEVRGTIAKVPNPTGGV